MSTTLTNFLDPTHLVFTSCRTPDLIRSATRNEYVDNATVANRSNYTRVTFSDSRSAAFLIPVGPYALRIRATPSCGAGVNLLGLDGERVGMAVSAAEMRAMAYGLLAAANWIDSRDNPDAQRTRKPR